MSKSVVLFLNEDVLDSIIKFATTHKDNSTPPKTPPTPDVPPKQGSMLAGAYALGKGATNPSQKAQLDQLNSGN